MCDVCVQRSRGKKETLKQVHPHRLLICYCSPVDFLWCAAATRKDPKAKSKLYHPVLKLYHPVLCQSAGESADESAAESTGESAAESTAESTGESAAESAAEAEHR